MNLTEQSKLIKEVAIFCLKNRGRCFEGWEASKIFKFIAWHWLNGTLFTVEREGEIFGVTVAWKTTLKELFRRDRENIPQFDWGKLPKTGDCTLITNSHGNRDICSELWKSICSRWPESVNQKVFTYRRGKLVEFISMKKFLKIGKEGV